MYRFMTALLCSDRPRATQIIGCRLFDIILSLAVHAANGVDGRKIKNIEAHFGDVI